MFHLKYVIFVFVVNLSVSNANLSSRLTGQTHYNSTKTLLPDLIQQVSNIPTIITTCSDAGKWTCDNDSKSFPVKGCYCDNLCDVMNDCCPNHTPNDVAIANVFNESMFECLNFPTIVHSSVVGVLAVSMCPKDWTVPEIQELCERNPFDSVFIEEYNNSSWVNNSSDITFPELLQVPAIDNGTGFVYKNIFCAYCHGEINDLSSWQTQMEDGIDSDDGSQTMHVSYVGDKKHRVTSDNTGRLCLHNYVLSDCPMGVDDNDTTGNNSTNCTNGDYELVYDVNDNMYRNKHCALCNGVQIGDIRCEPTNDISQINPPGFGYNNFVQVEEEEGIASNDSDIENIKKVEMNKIKDYLTLFGLIISVTSLVLTLLTYLVFHRLRARAGKIKMCLTTSLLLAQVLSLSLDDVKDVNTLTCKCFAILTYYLFLTTFCWMNVMAFDICRAFSKKSALPSTLSNRKMFMYCLYAFGIPLLLVLTSVLLDVFGIDSSFNPRYGERTHCWFSTTNSILLFFLGPLGLCKVFDLIAFSITVAHIIRTRNQASKVGRRHGKSTWSVLICLKLSLIMGFSWIIAFIANAAENDIIWLLFIMFNTLQGLFLFLCFVCNKTVFKMWRSKFSEVKSHVNSMSMMTYTITERGTERQTNTCIKSPVRQSI